MRLERAGLATPRRGHLRFFVLVLRVASRAPCLLDGVFDHRHDRMVGNAALARTVVVQNVTEPKPALLHENPPEPIPSGGMLRNSSAEAPGRRRKLAHRSDDAGGLVQVSEKSSREREKPKSQKSPPPKISADGLNPVAAFGQG